MTYEDKIFNYSMKKWYIDTLDMIPASKTNFLNAFAKAKDMEVYLGKDLCNWNVNEIINFLKLLEISSSSSIRNYVSKFKRYTDFCIENNIVDGYQNHYEELTDDLYMKCIDRSKLKRQTITREDILNEIRVIENEPDKFLILSIYEGLCSSNFAEVKTLTTTSIVGNVVHLSDGRCIEISNELKNLAYTAAEATEYVRTGPVKTRTLKLNTAYPKQIIKGYSDRECLTEKGLFGRFTYNMDLIGRPGVSTKKLRMAGAVRFIDLECKKYNVGIEEYLRDKKINGEFIKRYPEFAIANINGYINMYKEYLG